jgi:hypothetical protein
MPGVLSKKVPTAKLVSSVTASPEIAATVPPESVAVTLPSLVLLATCTPVTAKERRVMFAVMPVGCRIA